MRAGRRFTIVYDFDGTLFPSQPWDSEQELLLARLQAVRAPFWRRWYGRLVAEADRRGRLLGSFKQRYLGLLAGTPEAFVDQVAARLALRIPPGDIDAALHLKARGHRLIVASCGTADLSERILAYCGLRSCFEAVYANRFVFDQGRIAGLSLEVPSGKAKLELVESLGIEPDSAVAVGDGITDLPLWQWSAVPVVVDRARRTPPGRAAAPRWPAGWRVVGSCAAVLDIVRGLGG
jgi:phosphoserine phosphatase